MKLSKAQQAVMDEAKRDIDTARSLDFIKWYRTAVACGGELNMTDDEIVEELKSTECHSLEYDTHFEYFTSVYEQRRSGIVLTNCNSRTLYKLQEMGLIEIIFDSTGWTRGIDRVKILNY